MFKIAAYEKGKYTALIILGAIAEMMTVGLGLVYGELVNMVSRGAGVNQIVVGIVLALAYTLLLCGLAWASNNLINNYATKGVYVLRNRYVDSLLKAKFNRITSVDSSYYVAALSHDAGKLAGTYVYNLYFFFTCIGSVAFSFVSAMVLNWKIALTMVGFTVIMGILPLFLKKKVDKALVDVSEKVKLYNGTLKEYLQGVTIIKNFNAEKEASRIIAESNDELLKKEKRSNFINCSAGGLGNIVRQVAVVSLIGLTCYFVYLKEVEVGAVLSIYSIGYSFYGGILRIASIVTNLLAMKGMRETFEEVLCAEPEISAGAPEFNSAVTGKNVTFRYANGERNVLDGVDFRFEKDKKYLILGKSGSGKSTLLKLIAKLYDNYEGEIEVDGVDYKTYSERDVGAIAALSQQDCYLFNRTLADNIDFLKDGDSDKLQKILEQAEIADFAASLPQGLNTVIDEEVNQVSGGEKLRINLARALYRPGKILLLDEVTSALDKTTSEKVERNILSIKDKTVLNVCHKFNDGTLGMYDRILIIENGKIALEGSFEELKDNPKLNAYRNIDKK